MCTFFRFVNRRDILHTSLSTHTPRSLITPLSPQVPHFHRNSPLSHHTTHSPILLLFTTQHTLHSPLSRHTLSTLSPHIPYSHTTQSSPSHHTNLSAHTPVCHYKLLQFSFLPHHTLSILSTHHTPPTFTSKHSLTTHSHYHFTPHTPHSLNTPHTPNSLTTPHITNSLTAYSPLSHFTLPTFSPHILHFLAAHSPLSYHSLIPLSTLSPYHTIPTVSLHTPISHLTSYFRTSLISHLTPHSLTTLPTILLHFILSYKSQISFPTLEPHFATAHSHFHYALHSFTTLPHFSLYSSLSSHLISSPISHSRLSYLTPYTLSPPPLSPGRTLR